MPEPALARSSETEPLSALELAAWRGFLRVHAGVIRELDAELQAEHDLPLSSYEVLLFLADARRQRLRMAQLARSVLLSLSGVTRLVERLERQGLVKKEACVSDGRGVYAVLTEAGAERLAAARPTHLRGIRNRFISRFSADELRQLASQWDRLVPGSSTEIADLDWPVIR
jgi:DNA-binding MarR family transcriptional regulator